MRDSTDLRRMVLARLSELDRSQAWLARQVGREQYVIHRWLHGHPFPTQDRRWVAVALGRPVTWLLEPDETRQDAAIGA